MPGFLVCSVTRVTVPATENTSIDWLTLSTLTEDAPFVMTMTEETGGKSAMFLPKIPQKTRHSLYVLVVIVTGLQRV